MYYPGAGNVDEMAAAQLVGMGFDMERVKHALRETVYYIDCLFLK